MDILDDRDEFYNPFTILEKFLFEPADERTKQAIIKKYAEVGEVVTSVNFHEKGDVTVNFTDDRKIHITTEWFGD